MMGLKRKVVVKPEDLDSFNSLVLEGGEIAGRVDKRINEMVDNVQGKVTYKPARKHQSTTNTKNKAHSKHDQRTQ